MTISILSHHNTNLHVQLSIRPHTHSAPNPYYFVAGCRLAKPWIVTRASISTWLALNPLSYLAISWKGELWKSRLPLILAAKCRLLLTPDGNQIDRGRQVANGFTQTVISAGEIAIRIHIGAQWGFGWFALPHHLFFFSGSDFGQTRTLSIAANVIIT